MTNSHRLLPIHPSVFLGEGAKNFFSSCCFLWYGFIFDIYSAWFTWEICTVTQSLFQFTNRWLCPGRARHTEPIPLSTATHSGTQSQKVWPPANQEFFFFFSARYEGKVSASVWTDVQRRLIPACQDTWSKGNALCNDSQTKLGIQTSWQVLTNPGGNLMIWVQKRG